MNIIKFFLVIIYFFCCIINSNAEETIRLSSGEWPPYQSEHLKYFGVASRIITEAFALEGIKVIYGYYPWKRSYRNAENGLWDGTFLWFDTPERRKSFYISDPVIDVQYVFFHLKNYNFNWNNIEDIKGIDIGATIGYNYGEYFEKAEKSKIIRVQRVPKDEQNFLKLLNGRIQVLINELETGYDLIQNKFSPDQIKKFVHHSKPVKASSHHLLLCKKNKLNKNRIDIFNKGMKYLKKCGRFDQYIKESRNGEYRK